MPSFDFDHGGSSGHVLKQMRGRELVRAIRTVGKGKSPARCGVTSAALERLRRGKL
jgi:hypothetical protein